MKFIFKAAGSMDIVIEELSYDVLLGTIVMGADGVYMFCGSNLYRPITGRHLSQIAEKLSELNRSWMDAESFTIRAAYL